jgi:hypothetical protein
MFVNELDKMLDAVQTQEDLDKITKIMASGDVQYVFPVPLKMLLIKYAALVNAFSGHIGCLR